MVRRKSVLITATVAVISLGVLLAGCGSTGASSTAPPPPPPAQANVTASPTSADFGSVLVGTTATRTVTLTNSGAGAANVTAVNASNSSFGVASLALPATIAPAASLDVSITFSPSSAGSASGTLSFISDATNSPTTVSVTGNGTSGAVAQIGVSPGSINFGSITVNTSASRTLTISNAGTVTLNVTSAAVNGTAFSVSGATFPLNINAGGSNAVTVTFAPTTTGNQTGNITISSNASNQISPVNLSGSATAPPNPMLSVSPTTWSFGQVAVGGTSSKSVTLTNTGNATVSISAANVTGSGYSVSGITFPRSVTAGASTTATINFAPSAPSSSSGSISFVSNANNSPAVMSVSGSGFTPVAHSVDLNWSASTSVVTGYQIYRSLQSGSGYQRISTSLVPVTTFTDSTVQSGQTYFYVVTSVNAQNVESFFSNEAVAVVPIP